MAAKGNYLAIALKGSAINLVGSGLVVAQDISADGLGYIDFRVDGTALGWDYDGGTTDRVALICETNGDNVALTRVGDYWRWTVGPDDLRTGGILPGSSSNFTCQIVVTRTTAGDTASNAPGRWVSEPFTVTIKRITGFTPDHVSGLEAWYDAYDFLSTASGTAVATWEDKSPYGRDLTEATNRPTVGFDGAGRPFVLFDGSNDVLATSWAQFGDPSTLFVVGQIDSYDATVRGFAQVGGTGGARLAFDNANLKGATGADIANGTLPALDTPFVGTVTKASGGAVTIRKGTGSETSQASAQAVTDGTLQVGDTAADSAAAIRVYEIVVYNTVLSSENQHRVIRALQKKWNATG